MMNLRNRLTSYTTITFGIVFLLASLIIFIAFYNKSRNTFYAELQNNTWLSAIYYLEQDELSFAEHSAVKDQFTSTILNNNVAIYDSINTLAYGNLHGDSMLIPALLDEVRLHKKYQFNSNEAFYYGLFYPDNQGDFVVILKKDKSEFLAQIQNLVFILLSVLMLGIISIYFVSRYISNIAYKPIKIISNSVNQIDFTNLEQGIEVPDTNDELADLIKTYNNLLLRLSNGYLMQKNFINYVSHEFKTPLTVIAGSLEVFGQQDRTPEEYKLVSKQAINNIYKLEDILNNLLLLAGLHRVPNDTNSFRIDELIWDIHDALQDKLQQQNTTLDVDFQVDDYALLEQTGNQTLNYIALYNLIENAVKYANANPITLQLKTVDSHLQLCIIDRGKGISEIDLAHIKETFYRGNNVGEIKGSGIGLSLATKILDQHNVVFHIRSILHQGTTITLDFPNKPKATS